MRAYGTPFHFANWHVSADDHNDPNARADRIAGSDEPAHRKPYRGGRLFVDLLWFLVQSLEW